MLEITSPSKDDWAAFRRLAESEGWRIPAQELGFYRKGGRGSAFVLKREGDALGFVTLFSHHLNGWIGNLLVPPDCRGMGYGTRLFEHAFDVLGREGIENVWLTASKEGLPLYHRRGFQTVDGIERWVLSRSGAGEPCPCRNDDAEAFYRLDTGVWGESRRDLLASLAEKGTLVMEGRTGVLLQDGAGMQVLGPWISEGLCPRENRQVLAAALSLARPWTHLVTDVVASSPVRTLLAAAGFKASGTTELMVRGSGRRPQFESLVALASLGSLG